MVEIADLDFSKAFDKLSHYSLVNEMETCRLGVRAVKGIDCLLEWARNDVKIEWDL